MDKSLLLPVHMCFSVDLGLPDFRRSDFPGMDALALVTYKQIKRSKIIITGDINTKSTAACISNSWTAL